MPLNKNIVSASPVVTVLIPVYNGENYLEDTFLSIKKQDFKDYEVRILNDFSTDQSQEIIDKICLSDNRFIQIKHHQKCGSAASVLNIMFKGLKSEYVVYSSQDDFFSVDWLSSMISRAEETKADMVIPYVQEYRHDNYGHIYGSSIDRDMVISGKDAAILSLNWTIPGNALTKSKLIVEAGLYDTFSTNSDEYSVRKFFMYAKKVAFSNGYFYYRQDNPNAVTKKISINFFDWAITDLHIANLLYDFNIEADIIISLVNKSLNRYINLQKVESSMPDYDFIKLQDKKNIYNNMLKDVKIKLNLFECEDGSKVIPMNEISSISRITSASSVYIDQKDRGLPLVSIVIPSYKPDFFEQTLKSALGQTYPNIQVLVSDNCPDESIKQICDKYPSVIYQRSYFTRDDNIRTALFSGAGKYIKPLFDDDILHPFCVEFFVNALESRSDLSFVFSASAIINQQNQTTRVRRRFEGNQLFSKTQFHDIVFSGPTNPVGEFSTVMFSREVLWKLGLDFDKIKYRKIGCLTDVVFFLNLVQHGQAMYLDKELSYFRRDQTYQSNSNPEYNPNFGYCFADYLSILMDYDQQGLYQLDYENLGNGYFNIAIYLAEKFPMVKDVFKEFSDYVKEKYHVTIGFEEQKKLDIELVNQLKNNMSVMDAFTAGNTLIAQNQPEKAKKLYQQWLDLYPTANGRHVVYHALGLILAQQKDAGNAKIAFEQALQAMPSFHKSRYSLAQQLIKLNQITEAQETLRFLVAPSNNLVAENPALYNVAIDLLAKI